MPAIDFSPEVAEQLLRRRSLRPGDDFKRDLARDGRIVAAGIYDAFGGRAARDNYLRRVPQGLPCAFNAAYLGGWSVSAMLLQRPDAGFLQRDDMVFVGKYAIPAAWPLPVIVDAETGFCQEPENIVDTVREYDRIGVALAHLEDQATRRCGNLPGKVCLSVEDFIVKIRYWLMQSDILDTSMQLMVRTDALTAAGGGLDDAINRMKRYMDVEYNGRRPLVSWADALIDRGDLERWSSELLRHDPTMVLGINYSPNKDWTNRYRERHASPPPSYDDLVAMGFRVIWHTTLQARADMESGLNIFDQMADKGAGALHEMHERLRNHPAGQPQGLTDFQEWSALEKHVGGEAAEERYRQATGNSEVK